MNKALARFILAIVVRRCFALINNHGVIVASGTYSPFRSYASLSTRYIFPSMVTVLPVGMHTKPGLPLSIGCRLVRLAMQLLYQIAYAAPSGGSGRSNCSSFVISRKVALTAGRANRCSLSFSSICGYSSI